MPAEKFQKAPGISPDNRAGRSLDEPVGRYCQEFREILRQRQPTEQPDRLGKTGAAVNLHAQFGFDPLHFLFQGLAEKRRRDRPAVAQRGAVSEPLPDLRAPAWNAKSSGAPSSYRQFWGAGRPWSIFYLPPCGPPAPIPAPPHMNPTITPKGPRPHPARARPCTAFGSAGFRTEPENSRKGLAQARENATPGRRGHCTGRARALRGPAA